MYDSGICYENVEEGSIHFVDRIMGGGCLLCTLYSLGTLVF